jgi:inward rectifier potassium channel
MPVPHKVAPHRQRGAMPRIRAIGRKRTVRGDLYHYIVGHGWFRLLGIVAAAFLGVNALFSAAYLLLPGSIAHARPGSFVDAFFFSIETMATIGYGEMTPATPYSHVLVTIQALVGVVGFALIAGITFAKFSRPTARVVFSEKAVVAPRNGVPHLMFRMANWRHNEIVEAELRVVLLLDETTAEGDFMRRQIDVPLVRSRSSLFALTWTALHRIDDTSPFFGTTALTELAARQGELLLSLQGYDERFAQIIHARHRYGIDDVVVGARFADVLSSLPDGTRVIDYHRFHQIRHIGESPSEKAT